MSLTMNVQIFLKCVRWKIVYGYPIITDIQLRYDFLSDCRYCICYVQYCQAMLERGVCEQLFVLFSTSFIFITVQLF